MERSTQSEQCLEIILDEQLNIIWMSPGVLLKEFKIININDTIKLFEGLNISYYAVNSGKLSKKNRNLTKYMLLQNNIVVQYLVTALINSKNEVAELNIILAKSQNLIDKLETKRKVDKGTGLFTYEGFIGKVSDFKTPYAIAVGDLDNFKTINDNFSHAKGDEAIQKIAEVIKTSVRPSDPIGRFYDQGDEFILAFPIIDHQEIVNRLSRIQQHIDQLYTEGKIPERIGITFVYSIYNQEESLTDAIKNMDELLMATKKSGDKGSITLFDKDSMLLQMKRN